MMVSIVALAFVAFVATWFLFPFALRKMAEKRLSGLCRKSNAIVLSFDDGPSAGFTPRLLDLLADRNVKATFFVIGRAAHANAEILQQALRDGHEVGSHTFAHSNAWKVGPRHAARDLAAGIRAVETLGGDPRLFRPPFGKLTFATLVDCLLRRLRLGWWTIDSKDTWAGGDRRPAESILAQIRADNGGVVLAHDFDRNPNPAGGMSHAEYIIDLTERIIDFAEENGYRIMRLGEVLKGGSA